MFTPLRSCIAGRARATGRAERQLSTEDIQMNARMNLALALAAGISSGAVAQTAPDGVVPSAAPPAAVTQHDGAHDFDFLIGDWKAHVWRLPDRLVGSNHWIEYTGISDHKKLLDTNANFEDFRVESVDKTLHLKGQTLRVYNPASHQWSIYLLDLDNGELDTPPVVGQFDGNRGEFFDQENWKGRAIIVRYVWMNLPPEHARMEQSFSADGGKTWEVNWVCELSKE
jgi:hypothetical protein